MIYESLVLSFLLNNLVDTFELVDPKQEEDLWKTHYLNYSELLNMKTY